MKIKELKIIKIVLLSLTLTGSEFVDAVFLHPEDKYVEGNPLFLESTSQGALVQDSENNTALLESTSQGGVVQDEGNNNAPLLTFSSQEAPIQDVENNPILLVSNSQEELFQDVEDVYKVEMKDFQIKLVDLATERIEEGLCSKKYFFEQFIALSGVVMGAISTTTLYYTSIDFWDGYAVKPWDSVLSVVSLLPACCLFSKKTSNVFTSLYKSFFLSSEIKKVREKNQLCAAVNLFKNTPIFLIGIIGAPSSAISPTNLTRIHYREEIGDAFFFLAVSTFIAQAVSMFSAFQDNVYACSEHFKRKLYSSEQRKEQIKNRLNLALDWLLDELNSFDSETSENINFTRNLRFILNESTHPKKIKNLYHLFLRREQPNNFNPQEIEIRHSSRGETIFNYFLFLSSVIGSWTVEPLVEDSTRNFLNTYIKDENVLTPLSKLGGITGWIAFSSIVANASIRLSNQFFHSAFFNKRTFKAGSLYSLKNISNYFILGISTISAVSSVEIGRGYINNMPDVLKNIILVSCGLGRFFLNYWVASNARNSILNLIPQRTMESKDVRKAKFFIKKFKEEINYMELSNLTYLEENLFLNFD